MSELSLQQVAPKQQQQKMSVAQAMKAISAGHNQVSWFCAAGKTGMR